MNTCDGSFFDVIAVRKYKQVFKVKRIIACYAFFLLFFTTTTGLEIRIENRQRFIYSAHKENSQNVSFLEASKKKTILFFLMA